MVKEAVASGCCISMADIVFDNIGKLYGSQVAVDGVSMRIESGEFVTLLGPSGCGKTTCLRMAAGFVVPSSGRVVMGERDVTYVPPHKRNTGMVFQSYALFPGYTVAGNIAFGLKLRKLPKPEIERRTNDILRMVRLEDLAGRYPSELSGGQKQRVALARAVVIQPDVLLLDEPLAALDLKLREGLQLEIRSIQRKLGITTIFVTHDQDEALKMSDRVAVMRDGRIEQIATPEDLYSSPNSAYVATFVGHTNLFEVIVREKTGEDSYVVSPSGDSDIVFRVEKPMTQSFSQGETCLLGVRPEDIQINGGLVNSVNVSLQEKTYSGRLVQLDFKHPYLPSFSASASGNSLCPRVGETVSVSWGANRGFLLKN